MNCRTPAMTPHGFGTYRASGNNKAQLNQALRAIAQASPDPPLCPSVSGRRPISSGSEKREPSVDSPTPATTAWAIRDTEHPPVQRTPALRW